MIDENLFRTRDYYTLYFLRILPVIYGIVHYPYTSIRADLLRATYRYLLFYDEDQNYVRARRKKSHRTTHLLMIFQMQTFSYTTRLVEQFSR